MIKIIKGKAYLIEEIPKGSHIYSSMFGDMMRGNKKREYCLMLSTKKSSRFITDITLREKKRLSKIGIKEKSN